MTRPRNNLRMPRLKLIIFAVFLGLLTPPCFALDKVVFQLDWLPGGDKAPIYSGIQEGFFKEVGIEVKISPGRGSTDALTKLATRRADIGSAGFGALLSAKAQQDIPVSAVASIFTQGPHAFISYEGSGIQGIDDIRSKRIATSPFTSSNVYLPLILEQNNMMEEMVKLVYADPGALGPMLTTGRTDAIIAWMTDLDRYQSQLAKRNKKLVVIPWSEAGMDIYGIALVANNHFLKTRPDVARRFIQAFRRAIAFVNQYPEKAALNVNAVVPEVSTKAALGAIKAFNRLSNNSISETEGKGRFTQNRVKNTWQWVAGAQALEPDGFDPMTAIRNEFIED